MDACNRLSRGLIVSLPLIVLLLNSFAPIVLPSLLRRNPPIVCDGCMQSIEPWGDVLGDNPIARKSEKLKQIGDGGGDPTIPLNNALLDRKFHTVSGDVQPGPDPTIPHEAAVKEPVELKLNVQATLQHGSIDTLDNKCFYCDECPEKFGQKCYMLENQYDPKYADGVCLGLSFLWVHAKGWDGFIETLSSNDGRKVIQDIMDGQELYMQKTHFPPNYAKGLMTEMYNIPAGEIDVEMVELGHDNPRSTFQHFIQRAITGPDADGHGKGPIHNCIVIVFSKAHAMAIRVTPENNDVGNEAVTKYHFFDPNYGQFGMETMDEFVERLWHFVQPPNVPTETALPAYGDVWAYVRHQGGGDSTSESSSPPLQQLQQQPRNDNELGSIATEESKSELPFVPENAAVLPLSDVV